MQAQINVDQFYADVETKHQQQRKVSAIDVDIFVNKVSGDNYVDEMADIVHKLRLTEEASNALPSTSHALVRNLLSHDQIDFLLHILRDPLNYGVFLDTFTANLVLDQLLEQKKFTAATEVASFLMLQEDFGDDISRSLSLLAAYKYLDNPEDFVKVEAPVESAVKTPVAPVAKGKKAKKEDLRVRVKFLRNEYNDDHFHIKDSRLLAGKTLVRLSAELPKKYQSSSKLLGLCLYEKYADCLSFIETLNKDDVLYKEGLEKAVKILQDKPHQSEEYESLLKSVQQLQQKAAVIEQSLETDIVAEINSAITRLEADTIKQQDEVSEYNLKDYSLSMYNSLSFFQTYKSWISNRDARLQEELLRLKRVASVKEFEQLAQDMEMEEKKLWYFENEEKIELEIESKQVFHPKRWFGKRKNPRVVDEGYVPPEIKTVRNW